MSTLPFVVQLAGGRGIMADVFSNYLAESPSRGSQAQLVVVRLEGNVLVLLNAAEIIFRLGLYVVRHFHGQTPWVDSKLASDRRLCFY